MCVSFRSDQCPHVSFQKGVTEGVGTSNVIDIKSFLCPRRLRALHVTLRQDRLPALLT